MGTAPSPWDVSAPHPHPGTKGGTWGREDRSGAGGCSLPSSPNDAAAGWAGGVPSPHSPFGVRGTAAPFMYSSIYICTRDGDDGPSPGPPPSPELSLRPSTRRGGQVGSLGSLQLRWGRGSSAPSPSLGCSPAAPWVWDGGALCFLAAKGGTGCGGRVLRCTRIPLPIGRSRPLWPLLWLIHGWGMPRGCRWGAGGKGGGGVI